MRRGIVRLILSAPRDSEEARGRAPFVSWLAAGAFSRGQFTRVGLTSAGIRLPNTTALLLPRPSPLLPKAALRPWPLGLPLGPMNSRGPASLTL